MESLMPFRARHRFGHRAAALSSIPFAGFAGPPWSFRAADDPRQTLEWHLVAAQQLVRPGFMTLRAVRHGGLIVDFMWIFASAGAGRMLDHEAVDLYGKRLLDVLADKPGREAVFEQYRCVLEMGAATATKQLHQIHGAYDTIRHDTIRHGAVRLGDGVAVTLINVSAVRRAHELRLALQAQQSVTAAHAG
jgi:hypothetical protein